MRHLPPEKYPLTTLMILTLFAMVGPVSIDIFTPSLPAITEFFGTDNATAQWSVGIFMLGFSLSMLIVGPIADRFGRKNTLIGGYSLFLIATLVILNTDNVQVFIAARFAQAVFGCFGTAVARMLARDYFSDHMEVKMLSHISAGLTVAPMAAPILGGYIQEYAGWQYSFMVMAAMGVISMIALTLLPEKAVTNKEATKGFFNGFRDVLTDGRYMRFTVGSGAAFAGAFVFVAGGSFVFIEQLGLAPTTYGYFFAMAIAGYLLSASLGPRLTRNMSRGKSTLLSGALLLVGSLVCLITGLMTEGGSYIGYVAGIVIYELGLGLFLPLCQARATEHMKKNIGTASGLIFFIEMLLATIISSMMGLLPETGTLSLSVITLIAIGITSLCLLGIDRKNINVSAQTA